MAVQLKPAPILAHSSSSQRARLRAIREELSPGVFGSGTSNDDLIRSIQGSIAQTSAMWLLHRGLDVVQDHGKSLEQQILQFSSAVFDAIGSSYPVLRNVAQERLWLIYFKGLLSANTHPHEEMVSALRNLASMSGLGGLASLLAKARVETTTHTPSSVSDDEALRQIARGLQQQNSSFET